MSRSASVVVVSGVAGSGKTTVGRGLAERLGVPFADADDLHPPANVAKMAGGTPLDDTDRMPWLDAVADWIGAAEHDGAGGVVACSALKRSHRDRLRRGHRSVWLVQLVAEPSVLARRMAERRGHFMPPGLLDSQLADLQPLAPDEPGMIVDAALSPGRVIGVVMTALAR
ncbi:MAG TPA: gluconokinase [Jiangellaceae bacterium]